MNPDVDKKFDSLRNAPTELSRQQVESIIKGLPLAPAAPVDATGLTSWFSLNNLLIVGFVGAVGAGLLLWNKMPDQVDVLTVNEAHTPAVTMTDVSPVVPMDDGLTVSKNDAPTIIDATDAVPEKTEASSSTKMHKASSGDSQLTKKVDRKAKVSAVVIDQLKVEKQEVVLAVQNSTTSNVKSETKPNISTELELTETISEEKDIPEIKFEGSTIIAEPQAIQTDPNVIPDLTNGEMRRLKKSLFANLLDDELIINKWKEVEIVLPGNEIIVNGKGIDGNLFNKYSRLTKKVGWGPDRKIKFDDEYIKVGDFTATGFKGSGFGTFRSTPKRHMPDEEFNSEKLSLRIERAIKKEQRELDAFSQTLLDTSNGRRGRKNVLDVNLKQKKCKKLHQKLYEMLLDDGIIEKKEDYVLVEISKKHIYVNVLQLNEILYEKYSELFDSYKIKAGPRRQIRMSEHTIRVGDFSRGSFTGTSLMLTE